jgi:hypothetical protein
MKRKSKKMSGNEAQTKPAILGPKTGANTLAEKITSTPNKLKYLFQNLSAQKDPNTPSRAGNMFFRSQNTLTPKKKKPNQSKKYFLPDSDDEDPSDLCQLSFLDQIIAISTCSLNSTSKN